LYLYLTHIKGVKPKMNKPELENYFVEKDIKMVKELDEN